METKIMNLKTKPNYVDSSRIAALNNVNTIYVKQPQASGVI